MEAERPYPPDLDEAMSESGSDLARIAARYAKDESVWAPLFDARDTLFDAATEIRRLRTRVAEQDQRIAELRGGALVARELDERCGEKPGERGVPPEMLP